MGPVGKRAQLPLARTEGLLIEEIDSEMVIFDSETKQAHCLAPLASVVLSHCNGKTDMAELARIASESLGEPVSEVAVDNALAQLGDSRLLATPLPIRISRRDMIHKSAAFGAAAAAATLIFTVDPPMAWASACTNTACSRNSQCVAVGKGGCGSLNCKTCVSNACVCG